MEKDLEDSREDKKVNRMENTEKNIQPEYAHLYIKADNEQEALLRLMDIVKILRVKCPWDMEQTHESLRKCMIEEAYEAVEAINKGDDNNLAEELGDVMLQVIFHSQLASERKSFNFVDIANMECEKMIRRHPHVFLKETVKSIDKALEKWENVKRNEKGNKKITSTLENIPIALPALIRGYKVQEKAATVGFDWEDVRYAFHKIKEETEELEEAISEDNEQHMMEELGDLLFSVVNVARFLKIDPEDALNLTSNKFIKRFAFVEENAAAQGRAVEDLSLEEMDEFWEMSKKL